jgi:NAD(P)H-dependent FMN reductase
MSRVGEGDGGRRESALQTGKARAEQLPPSAPAWRSVGRTFFDQPGPVLTGGGGDLASYPTIACDIARRDHSQRSPSRTSQPSTTRLKANVVSKTAQARTWQFDLRDYPMPFFEEERSPMLAPPKSAIALRRGKKMAELDGYIFVTAEYNHGLPAVLKNALDYAYAEYNRKPATFVGYGSAGAARAVEQLRLVLAEQQVATLKHTVHVNAAEFIGMLMHGKTFADFSYFGESVAPMLENLVWWANVLKAGRQPTTHPIAVRA